MALPDFQSTMLPLLEFCKDGQEHSNHEALDALAARFDLFDEERTMLLPSGNQRVFDNRVAWARFHMLRAGLIENTARGVFRITARGKGVLAEKPAKINIRFLRQFPEYVNWRSKTAEKKDLEASPVDASTSPTEQLEDAYEVLRENLADELLAKLKSCTPAFFEKVVVEVLVKMGYGGSRKDAGQAIGKVGDEGIDGIIKEDRLGLDVIYIQAKRWNGSVSRADIQQFAGALQGKRARKGIFITTSDFVSSARAYVENIDSKIVLIDGAELARLMIEHNVGVTIESVYEIKRLDSDYFVEE